MNCAVGGNSRNALQQTGHLVENHMPDTAPGSGRHVSMTELPS